METTQHLVRINPAVLKRAREERGMTQEKLAEGSQVSRRTIQGIERAAREEAEWHEVQEGIVRGLMKATPPPSQPRIHPLDDRAGLCPRVLATDPSRVIGSVLKQSLHDLAVWGNPVPHC